MLARIPKEHFRSFTIHQHRTRPQHRPYTEVERDRGHIYFSYAGIYEILLDTNRGFKE